MKINNHPNGLLASIAMQCIHPDTNETGDWLFSGESHKNKGSGVTPVFPDFVALLDYCQANGWTQIGHGCAMRYIYHSYLDKGKQVDTYMAIHHSNVI